MVASDHELRHRDAYHRRCARGSREREANARVRRSLNLRDRSGRIEQRRQRGRGSLRRSWARHCVRTCPPGAERSAVHRFALFATGMAWRAVCHAAGWMRRGAWRRGRIWDVRRRAVPMAAAVAQRGAKPGEWRGGVSPPRSLRTGREPLSSSGSRYPAVFERLCPGHAAPPVTGWPPAAAGYRLPFGPVP
jgi:hypothetical protein